MARWFCKVEHGPTSFRVNIPRKVVAHLGWQTVTHVIIEDHWGDKILIKRMTIEEDQRDDQEKVSK